MPLVQRYDLNREHVRFTLSLQSFSPTACHVLLADRTLEHERFYTAALLVVGNIHVGKIQNADPTHLHLLLILPTWIWSRSSIRSEYFYTIFKTCIFPVLIHLAC